jgi:hypothetical protein
MDGDEKANIFKSEEQPGFGGATEMKRDAATRK